MSEEIKITVKISDQETLDAYQGVCQELLFDDMKNGNLLDYCEIVEDTRTTPEYKYAAFENWLDNTIFAASQMGKAQARSAFEAARELKEK